jgi:hypothetical protein
VQSYISERWPYYKAAIEGVQADILQIQSYLAKSAEYNFNMWKTSKDPASEKNMSHSAVVTRINTNVSSRINDLNTLITNKRYK